MMTNFLSQKVSSKTSNEQTQRALTRRASRGELQYISSKYNKLQAASTLSRVQ
jgi:hypothetical protein